jgi:hypothetical protein
MQGQSIGSVEYGEVFTFTVSNRGEDGLALDFTPAYFDVVDPVTGLVVLSNEVLVQYTATDITTLWFGSIDTGVQKTDQDVAWFPNRTYALIVKEDTTDNPITDVDPQEYHLFNFTVTGAYSVRLKRLLSLDGENVLIDKMVYDSGNNATSMRVRVFDTRANAQAATVDISPLESGELYRYTVTQTFQTGIHLRKSHRSLIDTDQGDL